MPRSCGGIVPYNINIMIKNLLFSIALLLCSTNMLADRMPSSRYYYENGIKYIYYGIEDNRSETFVVSFLHATVVFNQQNPYSGNVIIPNSVLIKGEDISYYDGTKWTDEVSMPVDAIDDDAFVDCKGLVSVTIPASISFQGEEEFEFFTVRRYNLNNPFRGCSNLEKIVFEEGHSFYNECNAIIVNNKLISGCKNTIVPEEVKTIGPNAFSGLETMVSIDINKVTTINEGAFKGCNNIHGLVCRSSFPPHIAHSEYIDELYWNDVFDESMKNATLYVNDFCIEKYKKDKIWNQFKEIVPIEKVTDFNLTYYVDGEVYKTAQYKYDDEITPLEDPIKEGHTFSGWSEIPERMPGRDVNVYGSFTVNNYKITYLVDGEEYKTYDVKYGAIITPESEPRKEGFTFSGWSAIPETMPAQDITITGSFSINSYKLTYKVDREEYRVFEVEYNEIITPEVEPTKKGMTFSGWSGLPEKMPAKDVEVTGFFSWSKTSIDDVIYQVSDTINNCASVIGGGNERREVKIIPTIEFDDIYTVTTINHKAFNGRKNLEKIEICENVTSIGERAFANIDKLTDVTIYAEILPETDRTAFENSYIHYVTLHVPYGAIDEYQAIGPWKDFKEIIPIEGTEPIYVETCALPTISFVDGKLVFESETVGAECHYEINVEDAKAGVGSEVTLSSAYEIMVYASKEGYNDSEKNTATLYWVNVDPIPTDVIDNEIRVNTNAILVQNAGGVIAISGVADGVDVMIYNISGQLTAQGKASGNRFEIGTNLSSGDICIIKIDNRSLKYILR